MIKHARAATLLLGGLAIAACSGVKYSSDFDPTADFSDYRAYAWAERTPTGDDDPRVYNDIVKRQVQYAVDQALAAKGYQKVTSNAHFYVGWHGAIDGRMSTTTINDHYGYGRGWYGPTMGVSTSRTYVNEWDEGTLLVDIIDATSDQLVWRGSAQAEVNKSSRGSEEDQRRLNEIVAKMLEQFPPNG
jgi:hypothetical protein